MECSCRRSFVAIILYLIFQDKVLCQTISDEVRENRDCNKLSGKSSSIDRLNSILASVASNGVLPDLLPMLQSQQIADNFPKYPLTQDILTKPLSVVPIPSSSPQEPIIFSNQPIKPSTLNQNVLLAKPLSCGSSGSSNMMPAVTQSFSPPLLPTSNCISQIAQALSLENYPTCAPNIVQPMPIVLQPQAQCNDFNPYFYNQIVEPILLPELITNPTFPGTLEVNPCLELPCSLSTLFPNDAQQTPLQINLPIPNIGAPRVTVVSASPLNSPVSVPVPSSLDYSASLPSFQYPQPPIIVGKSSKSSLQKWLPILLMAMFNDRGSNDGCGGCRCCCSGNCGSGNNIPIPYPIPIPINNPVINTSSCASRNRENREEEEDDEDQKQK